MTNLNILLNYDSISIPVKKEIQTKSNYLLKAILGEKTEKTIEYIQNLVFTISSENGKETKHQTNTDGEVLRDPVAKIPVLPNNITKYTNHIQLVDNFQINDSKSIVTISGRSFIYSGDELPDPEIDIQNFYTVQKNNRNNHQLSLKLYRSTFYDVDVRGNKIYFIDVQLGDDELITKKHSINKNDEKRLIEIKKVKKDGSTVIQKFNPDGDIEKTTYISPDKTRTETFKHYSGHKQLYSKQYHYNHTLF